MTIKTVATNRKAYHDYHLQDSIEAGIALTGTEIGSYLSHEPTRPRKLLLHRKQIDTFTSKIQEKGFTLIPLKLYIKDDIAKVEVALGRGKKLYDKREAIARREAEREIGRAIKRQRLSRR